MSKDYEVKVEWVNKELNTREKAKLINFSDAIAIDEALRTGDLLITVDTCAMLLVHNEKSENKDYVVYVYIDADGQKYTSSSESLFKEFTNIDDILKSENDNDPWTMKVVSVPSKNNQGSFFTCVLVD